MNRKGFTLVELAIVLVIIGVILGGVIKGQELVTSSKVKRLYRDFQQVEFAYFSYQDRYNNKPGDDATDFAADGIAAGAENDGDQDNIIDGTWTSNANEVGRFFAQIRAANLYSRSSSISVLPTNVYGTIIGVDSNIFGFNGDVVCFDNIRTDVIQQLDESFDDGVATNGDIRAGSDTTISDADYSAITEATRDFCIYLGR